MAGPEGDVPPDAEPVERQTEELANGGYCILAVALGTIDLPPEEISEEHHQGLTFLGLIGMIGPLCPESKSAVDSCRKAGVQVAMVTEDHPNTAQAIARELGMAECMDQVITESNLRKA
jgi:magnesium-transporting ATPase (P-type)